MNTWTKSCVNDTGPGDEGFDEWWEVEGAGRKYRCDTEADADLLIAAMQMAEQAELQTYCCQSCGAVIGTHPKDYAAMECVDLECPSCGSKHTATGCPAPDLAKQAIEKLKELGFKWDFDAADFVAEQPARRKPLTTQPLITHEQHVALREAFAIGASDSYFEANPTHNNDAGRMLFERGFARGFDSHARAIVAASQEQP